MLHESCVFLPLIKQVFSVSDVNIIKLELNKAHPLVNLPVIGETFWGKPLQNSKVGSA